VFFTVSSSGYRRGWRGDGSARETILWQSETGCSDLSLQTVVTLSWKRPTTRCRVISDSLSLVGLARPIRRFEASERRPLHQQRAPRP
jgi:hypothetical protein